MSVAAAPNTFQNNSNNELQVGQALHLPKITHPTVRADEPNSFTARSITRTASMTSHDRFRYNDSSMSFNKY